TPVGREFLPVVERVLGEIDAVAVNARELAGRQRGLVAVAALPSIASTVLPVTVAEFRNRHPGITVKLRDAVAQRVVDLVKSGEVDFGIGSPTTRDPELKVSHLMDDPVSVVLPPGHPLERRARVGLRDLLHTPLILMDREYSVRWLIERAFQSIGHSVAPAFEASYVSTAVGLVKAGLGVAVVARSAGGSAAELAGLRTRPIQHPTLVRHISLLENPNRSLSPAAQQFVDAVWETCRRTA
ncbi:MAG TPA: LysR substrate-binding domain-containing protein, partial [Dongiaceae bacterium]|nr:LysR substrate-binding domain-containing protein [Dongiaceae bacterium]